MRYLGNKSRLLPFIDKVIDKHGIKGETFVDLFAGTASVADHMKSRFEILANDFMYFRPSLRVQKFRIRTFQILGVLSLLSVPARSRY